jgi:hypothetical protein
MSGSKKLYKTREQIEAVCSGLGVGIASYTYVRSAFQEVIVSYFDIEWNI